MEESNTMATLHINVSGRPEISGTIPMPLRGTTTYSCPLGVFPITPILDITGGGSKPPISGSFSISAVPEDYGTVAFTGTYVSRGGGKGSGGVNWSGPRGRQDGTDTWTSDTTTPVPKRQSKDKAKAKGQGY